MDLLPSVGSSNHSTFYGQEVQAKVKRIVVINGKGKAGKSFMCSCLADKYKVTEISSVDKVKEAAKLLGWDGKKDDASRAFLHQLKQDSIDYDNGPTRYLISKAREFMQGDGDYLMVNIREPSEIIKFISACYFAFDIVPDTVLVKRDAVDSRSYGNDADDKVDDFDYEFTVYNNFVKEKAHDAFIQFFEYWLPLTDKEEVQ